MASAVRELLATEPSFNPMQRKIEEFLVQSWVVERAQGRPGKELVQQGDARRMD
jgi:hypothetical protein